MFSKEMIAPCGLDCNICIGRLRKDTPCPGCWGTGDGKSEHCAKLCKIVFCKHRKQLANGYCNTCAFYPCEHILRMEEKYQNEYPLEESLIDNFAQIEKYGMDKFLDCEAQKWTCSNCGGIISVHTGKCTHCGK